MYECTTDQQLANGVSGSAIRVPPVADQNNPRSAVRSIDEKNIFYVFYESLKNIF